MSTLNDFLHHPCPPYSFLHPFLPSQFFLTSLLTLPIFLTSLLTLPTLSYNPPYPPHDFFHPSLPSPFFLTSLLTLPIISFIPPSTPHLPSPVACFLHSSAHEYSEADSGINQATWCQPVILGFISRLVNLNNLAYLMNRGSLNTCTYLHSMSEYMYVFTLHV